MDSKHPIDGSASIRGSIIGFKNGQRLLGSAWCWTNVRLVFPLSLISKADSVKWKGPPVRKGPESLVPFTRLGHQFSRLWSPRYMLPAQQALGTAIVLQIPPKEIGARGTCWFTPRNCVEISERLVEPSYSPLWFPSKMTQRILYLSDFCFSEPVSTRNDFLKGGTRCGSPHRPEVPIFMSDKWIVRCMSSCLRNALS